MSRFFRGGVHPPEHKDRTAGAPIVDAPASPMLVVPFAQHIGKPAEPIVKPGVRVLRGQKLAEHSGYVSAAVHAPVSGTVKSVVQTRHPLGFLVDAVRIDNDFQDEWLPDCSAQRTYDQIAATPRETLRQWIVDAGIVGMGGATFPTHVKLSPPENKPIDHVILNGIECEPYLTCDHRLMLEYPEAVVAGLRLFMHVVKAPKGVIGVEANKPDAVEALRRAVEKAGDPNLSVAMLPVMYPQGAEKQLIQAVLKREVPSGGLPSDVGVVVQNVASAMAAYEAVAFARPLTERVVTVAGPAVARPANYRVRIGTPAKHLLEAAGFDPGRTRRLLTGGPMMGLAQRDLDFVVVKGTGGIVALDQGDFGPYGPCIRCARCVDACPAGLLPCTLSILGERNRLQDARAENAQDCIECGICSYVCPAKRPILQWIRVEKMALARK